MKKAFQNVKQNSQSSSPDCCQVTKLTVQETEYYSHECCIRVY